MLLLFAETGLWGQIFVWVFMGALFLALVVGVCLAMDTSPDKSGARQFSLRKLFLWIMVSAVYFGVLRLTGIGGVNAIRVTFWLAVILIARLWWGLRGGMIAVSVMAIGWGFVDYWIHQSGKIFGLCMVGVVVFVPLGMVAYACITLVVRLVNWLDTLGRENSPPDS